VKALGVVDGVDEDADETSCVLDVLEAAAVDVTPIGAKTYLEDGIGPLGPTTMCAVMAALLLSERGL
jgi:hypothetical protein